MMGMVEAWPSTSRCGWLFGWALLRDTSGERWVIPLLSLLLAVGLSHAGGSTGRCGLAFVGRMWYFLIFAFLVMGFPGAAECCNCVAAQLKDDLQSKPPNHEAWEKPLCGALA